MLQYQFQVAIALAVSAACSLLVFLLASPKEGKIQLLPDAEVDVYQQEPFNVTKPEDAIHGVPVNEDVFWYRMRLRKIAVTILLFAILVIQCTLLGYSVMQHEAVELSVYIIHTAFPLYALILAMRSVNQQDHKHAESVTHLFALTCIATSSLFASSLLPSDELTNMNLTEGYTAPMDLWLAYTTLALYFLCLLIAITTPCGPPLHFPPEQIYSDKILSKASTTREDNVCGVTGASMLDTLLFSYTTRVVTLGKTIESLEIADLPILPADMRATTIFASMRDATRRWKINLRFWRSELGSGWELGYQLLRLNGKSLSSAIVLAVITAVSYYIPAYFLQHVIQYLELDPDRTKRAWGLVYCAGLFFSKALTQLIAGQLWSATVTTLLVRLRIQLNTILFAKTLVCKDIASFARPAPPPAAEHTNADSDAVNADINAEDKDDEDFTSKAQIMTLMTTDVDRVSEFCRHLFSLIDSPIELIIGTFFLYHLLGISCFLGLAVTCFFLPLNHLASKAVVGAQADLMRARDERVSLMNEILGAIRMLKFMAWERSFEERVSKIRSRELKYQRLNYHIAVLFSALWNASPILVTLVSFWHFAVIRQQVLTPSIAFTSISVFSEMKDALNSLPETLIDMIQSIVSMRRIEKYLQGTEVQSVSPLDGSQRPITLQNATISWPCDRIRRKTSALSAVPVSTHKFMLRDLTIEFPLGELSLICGKLGSGKTLLLLALLGEADLLTGQISCPRSPPGTISLFAGDVISDEEWIVQGVCAYVPQSAWLRNASIRDNILFDLPYVEERYQKTLEVCALFDDLEILEDGDMSEIGEKGVNLSGGQKARVSLARAVYSRASVLLLDDVLSAVDAHTAKQLYDHCLKGILMHGRTVILVSHHVQLCAPGASHIVALENGHVIFQGGRDRFRSSGVLRSLLHTDVTKPARGEYIGADVVPLILENHSANNNTGGISKLTSAISCSDAKCNKTPRKLIEEEKRAAGRIQSAIWIAYATACGGYIYWLLLGAFLLFAALSPVVANWWLRIWSGSALDQEDHKSPIFYIGIYAAISAAGIIISTSRWMILYHGGINASSVLHKRLLESVLYANIRLHDTLSRGRFLNRFGKDLEIIDSSLPDNLGRSIANCLSVVAALVAIIYVGGLAFLVAAIILAILYYNVGKAYGQTSRDMRRLDSITRSHLYSIYGEAIAGVTVLRAFGASTKFMREMLRCVDTNANPYYWTWGVNRWLSIRFNLLSSAVVGVTAFLAVSTPGISASLAGFALAFASSMLMDLLFLVRRFVSLEQAMVAVERIEEYSELPSEAPQVIEPRPPVSWPTKGAIDCQNLVIRYAPELPEVLHNLNFAIRPGEKIGVLGRTGSGKSTLAFSLFRFLEPSEGRILIDGLDIAEVGLADLRSKLTIIPQDPTILSGTLRTTLDVFNEYEDAEIYEALRRVHLITEPSASSEYGEIINANVFRDLDSPVSEGGDNFSTGEKQLLCMARAILKQSKVLVMDEATASVDYVTDELIGNTIRNEFSGSTILTIAHRLRTVIDYDRVMLLDQGRILEFDKPNKLLANPSSKFQSLCRATGDEEYAVLKTLAGLP